MATAGCAFLARTCRCPYAASNAPNRPLGTPAPPPGRGSLPWLWGERDQEGELIYANRAENREFKWGKEYMCAEGLETQASWEGLRTAGQP